MKTKPRNQLRLLLGVSIAMTLCFSSAQSQTLNTQWRQDLNTSLEQFIKCLNSDASKSSCNDFLAQSLKMVYNLNDFYSPSLGRYLIPMEISRFIKESDMWTLLGPSYEQKTLAEAQAYANANKAVIAVYTNPAEHGHIALIVPGELTPSGTWGLRVPNAVSFLPTEPDRSFIDKGLSYAFKKNMMKDVLIYARRY